MRTVNISVLVVFLFVLGACSSDKKDWQKAKELGSISAYEDYINNHLESDFVDSANYFIEEFYFHECKLENTDSSYNNFINLYPQSEFLDSVVVLVEKLDFDKAMHYNSLTSYLEFIKKYPKSKFLDKLRFEGEEIQISQLTKKYSKQSKSIFSKSSKSKYLKRIMKFPPNAKVNMGGGMTGTAGSEGLTVTKEFFETGIEEIFDEFVEFDPFIAVYIDKNTVLLSGGNGTKFKHQPNNKILITEGTLYKLTINK